MRVAVVGTGNIGTDLLEKLCRSETLKLAMFAGIGPASLGLARAKSYEIPTSIEGIDAVLDLDEAVDLVYEAASARARREIRKKGLRVVHLTPAKLGPAVVPAVNIDAVLDAPDVNMTSCGGQATVPMVAAGAGAADVEYADIASASAGPGTRQNIDEFTRTTASALELVGGARRGKATIILNPAEPPLLMRNTVTCVVPAGADLCAIRTSIEAMTARVQVLRARIQGHGGTGISGARSRRLEGTWPTARRRRSRRHDHRSSALALAESRTRVRLWTTFDEVIEHRSESCGGNGGVDGRRRLK